MNDFEGAIILKGPNPFAAFDYDDKDRVAFIKWWRETGFPKLKKEFGAGTFHWTTAADDWALIAIDNPSGMQLAVMRPARGPEDRPFYLEPKDENIEKIAAVFRAARAFYAVSRGRDKPDAS